MHQYALFWNDKNQKLSGAFPGPSPGEEEDTPIQSLPLGVSILAPSALDPPLLFWQIEHWLCSCWGASSRQNDQRPVFSYTGRVKKKQSNFLLIFQHRVLRSYFVNKILYNNSKKSSCCTVVAFRIAISSSSRSTMMWGLSTNHAQTNSILLIMRYGPMVGDALP